MQISMDSALWKTAMVYLRGSLVRPMESDSARRWAVGYGLDIAVPVNYTSHFIVQQAFARGKASLASWNNDHQD